MAAHSWGAAIWMHRWQAVRIRQKWPKGGTCSRRAAQWSAPTQIQPCPSISPSETMLFLLKPVIFRCSKVLVF